LINMDNFVDILDNNSDAAASASTLVAVASLKRGSGGGGREGLGITSRDGL
jgi:hypothetical protein